MKTMKRKPNKKTEAEEDGWKETLIYQLKLDTNCAAFGGSRC